MPKNKKICDPNFMARNLHTILKENFVNNIIKLRKA